MGILKTKKRVYIGLLLVSFLFMTAVAGIIWFFVQNRDIIISQVILLLLAIVFLAIMLVLGLGIATIIIMILRSRPIPLLEKMTVKANELLFPLALFLGGILRIEREKILRSFIEVNNYLVRNKKILIPGKRVMVLLPHCLQAADCPHKITMDINNCKKCGNCPVGDLIDLADQYGAAIKVATGGTLARKFIQDHKPQGVVAVACERDLSLGIQDAALLPVIGVLNHRPNGPCISTTVDLQIVENALKNLCKGGYA